MKRNLAALAGLLNLLVVLGLMLFLPAWTVRYWQAWAFLAVFGASVLLVTVYLMVRDPALLQRRLQAGPTAEQRPSQKLVQSLASLAFVGFFVIASLDRRFGWSAVPLPVVVAGDVVVALGLLVVFLVFRANTFTSATVEVMAGQKVVSTGPYAVVRHMLLGVPFALGSWVSLLCWPLIVVAIGARAVDEEKMLVEGLDGYADYQQKVRSRMFPGVW